MEVMALREALKWIIQLQLRHVVFETDYKVVVDVIQSHVIDQSELRRLVKDCKAFFFFKCKLHPSFYQKASQ